MESQNESTKTTITTNDIISERKLILEPIDLLLMGRGISVTDSGRQLISQRLEMSSPLLIIKVEQLGFNTFSMSWETKDKILPTFMR